MVTPTEIRAWLDKQIEARKIMNEVLKLDDEDEDLRSLHNYSATSDIHIGGKAVRYLAKVLDLELCVKPRLRDKENPYEVFVIYDHEVFFGIESKEEYRERGAVV